MQWWRPDLAELAIPKSEFERYSESTNEHFEPR